jgi:zinc and cadmium transporter
MDILWKIVLATLAGGVVSVMLAAALALTLLRRWAPRLVSFAVGVLLAAALLNLMPEAAGAWLLGGVLVFFVL